VVGNRIVPSWSQPGSEFSYYLLPHLTCCRIGAEQLTNANDVVSQTTRYGAAWQNVTGVLPPRMVKLVVQIDF
jgi:hypothetical protein